jgi:ABC-type bacteriocin/lantibiotic exporter with double-glycine peptidase domain
MFFPYFVQVTVLSKIENEVTFNLRTSLFQKLLRLPVRFYEIAENESGGAATSVTTTLEMHAVS